MTPKEYDTIAFAIREARPFSLTKLEGWSDTARTIANALRCDNPYFDVKNFLANCGVEWKG